MLQANRPPPETLELRLTASSVSAANSSITASTSMEGRRSVHCRSEDDDEGSTENTPHLMSAASDDEVPEFDSYSQGGESERFALMLQQQREQVNYPDDPNASVVFVGDEDQLSAGGEKSGSVESPFRTEKSRWVGASNCVPRRSRSRSRSSSDDSQSSTPVMMLVDLDDDDVDPDLPSMLTEANRGTKIFTSKMLSVGPLAAPEPRQAVLPPQPPPTPCSAQLHRNMNNLSHHRSNSSLSSSSSQGSFRSILRNGRTAKVGTSDSRSEDNKIRTPLVPRSANRREASSGRSVMATPNRPRATDKENPTQGIEARKIRGSVSERKQRGRSVEKKARAAKSSRSVSYSSESRRSELERRSERNCVSYSSASRRSESPCERNCDTNAFDGEESTAHRRTVSFPAELVQIQRSVPRNKSRSPTTTILDRSDDPAFVPILDTRRARKASSHVRNGTDISPRTADFLANDSPAVIAMCRAQDRERHHHNERPRFPELSTKVSFDTDKPRTVVKPVPKSASEEAVPQVNASKPPIGRQDSSSICSAPSSGSDSLRSTSTASAGELNRKEPKRRFFKFSASDRKGQVSFRRKPLQTIVGLLSPVDERGEGSTTCGLTPTTLTPTMPPEPISTDVVGVAKHQESSRVLVSVPSSTSSRGSLLESREGVVSPVSNELQKAANIVWGDNDVSPSQDAGTAKFSQKCRKLSRRTFHKISSTFRRT